MMTSIAPCRQQTFLHVYPGNRLLCFPDILGSELHPQVLPRQDECGRNSDYGTYAGTWPPCVKSHVPSCVALERGRVAGA